MAPMLILAGVKDTQVPIDDIYLLMNSGDVPKTAWINPAGWSPWASGWGVARPAHIQRKSSFRGWCTRYDTEKK